MKEEKQITLILYTCHTGEGEDNLAKQISKQYKNITVIAGDGSVTYGIENGKPAIIGVNNHEGTGGFIKYDDGNKISKKIDPSDNNNENLDGTKKKYTDDNKNDKETNTEKNKKDK